MQYTNNTAAYNFIHKSWLNLCHFLRLDSLETELLNQRIWIFQASIHIAIQERSP